jgi:hypothetical protein
MAPAGRRAWAFIARGRLHRGKDALGIPDLDSFPHDLDQLPPHAANRVHHENPWWCREKRIKTPAGPATGSGIFSLAVVGMRISPHACQDYRYEVIFPFPSCSSR